MPKICQLCFGNNEPDSKTQLHHPRQVWQRLVNCYFQLQFQGVFFHPKENVRQNIQRKSKEKQSKEKQNKTKQNKTKQNSLGVEFVYVLLYYNLT
jgi:hypothetical protein